MAKKFLTDINMAQRELQNAVIQKLAAAPSSPVQGQIYYDTTLGKQRQYNGSAWVDYLDSSVLDTDGSLAANSDSKLASQKAVKTYVDNAVQGLSWKTQVRAASTSNISLSTPGATIDGVTLSNGDRVALLGQTTASQNGIYVFNGASSALTRAKDADSGAELVNATFYVSEGTSNADTVWTCTTNAAITVDTTSLTFAQVNGGTVPTATTSVAGKVQLADQTETEARSNTSKAVTPGDLANFPYTSEHTIGDGSSTSIAITHNRGRKGVVVQVRQASDDAVVECDITMTSTTQVTLGFAVAPATNSVLAVIVG